MSDSEHRFSVSELDALACRALDRAAQSLRAGNTESALEWMNHAAALRELELSREMDVIAGCEVDLAGFGP